MREDPRSEQQPPKAAKKTRKTPRKDARRKLTETFDEKRTREAEEARTPQPTKR